MEKDSESKNKYSILWSVFSFFFTFIGLILYLSTRKYNPQLAKRLLDGLLFALSLLALAFLLRFVLFIITLTL